MIQITSIHHAVSSQPYIIRTKSLTLWGDVQTCFIIKAQNEHTVSIIEEFFLETLGDVSWEKKWLDEDFSYVTEKYNKFIKNVEHKSKDISIFFGVNIAEVLTFSVIGDISIVMKESNRKWSSISDTIEHPEIDFSYVSSGAIPYDSTMYISTTPLLQDLWSDLLDDLSNLDKEAFEVSLLSWMNREYKSSVDVIRIQRDKTKKAKISRMSTQIDVARENIENYFMSKDFHLIFRDMWTSVDALFHNKPKSIQTGIIISGLILCFFLLYILFYEVFNISNTATTATDSKQELIDAKGYMDTAEKNMSNTSIFTENIKKAEDILFTMRKNETYLKDTQELLSKISTMKKELNDIETVELGVNTSIVPFNPQDISPVRVFESEKKLTLIGKYGAIFDYAIGSPLPKVINYPLGEEAIDADMNPDGVIFILTKTNKILSKRQSTIITVNVDETSGWEKAKKVRTYNSNLYLIWDSGNEVFRHKPGANGFWPKSMILEGYSGSDIRDIGIDGGFFILKNSGQIRRIITSPVYSDKSIVLNDIPGDYSLSSDDNVTIFVRSNLSYIYMLDGNHIWIFQPDSKNYKDITSWKYIAQIEVSTKEEIRSLSIPYDGLIYLATNLGVYNIKYEIVDSKIMLK